MFEAGNFEILFLLYINSKYLTYTNIGLSMLLFAIEFLQINEMIKYQHYRLTLGDYKLRNRKFRFMERVLLIANLLFHIVTYEANTFIFLSLLIYDCIKQRNKSAENDIVNNIFNKKLELFFKCIFSLFAVISNTLNSLY